MKGKSIGYFAISYIRYPIYLYESNANRSEITLNRVILDVLNLIEELK